MEAIFLIVKSRILHRKALNILIILLLSVNVCVLNVALALSNGFETNLITKMLSFSPHIIINSLQKPDLRSFNSEIKDIIKIDQTQALAINAEEQTVKGIVIKASASLNKLLKPENLIAGNFPKNGEIMLGEMLADKLKIGIGNRLHVVFGPSSDSSYRVSGIFKIGLYDYDSTLAITSDYSLNSADSDSYYGIWLDNPLKAKVIAQEIMKIKPGIEISNWQDNNKALIDAVIFEKKLIFIVLSLLIIAVCFAISLTQLIQILNNKEKIAILLAVGFTPARLLILYAFEGFFLASIGVITGTILSFIFADNFSTGLINLPVTVYHIDKLPIILKKADIAVVSLLTILLSSIASLIPAIYAVKQSPIEILRNK